MGVTWATPTGVAMDPYRIRRGSRVRVHAGVVEIQDGQMARIAVHIARSSLHSLGEGRVLVKNPVVGSPIGSRPWVSLA